MPHFTMEYSANLASRTDIQAIADVVLSAALQTGVFEVGAIRVRAIECGAYAIADRHPENAFLDVSLRMGAGRSFEDKKRAGETIYAALSQHLDGLFKTPHFALSFEIREVDPVMSWKTNAMHGRLRGQPT